MTTVRQLYFSATIITLDGSDTNANGERCESGRGYTEQSGHWDPDRSYWTVHYDRRRVRPDVYRDSNRLNPARWLADRLTHRLGTLESFDGATFYGSRQAIHPGRLTGPLSHRPGAILGSGTLLGDAIAAARLSNDEIGLRSLTAAGHAHHFTEDELIEAATLLGLDHPDTVTRPDTL